MSGSREGARKCREQVLGKCSTGPVLARGSHLGQVTVDLVGAKVKVTLEIEAEVPNGTHENVVRTVTENSRTLKFFESWV
jgi:hypothetical protein